LKGQPQIYLFDTRAIIANSANTANIKPFLQVLSCAYEMGSVSFLPRIAPSIARLFQYKKA